MESETLMLNLGSQAAAALVVLTATRCGLPTPARALAGTASGQLWSSMKQRWRPANRREGK